jgi:hypothetical protein
MEEKENNLKSLANSLQTVPKRGQKPPPIFADEDLPYDFDYNHDDESSPSEQSLLPEDQLRRDSDSFDSGNYVLS